MDFADAGGFQNAQSDFDYAGFDLTQAVGAQPAADPNDFFTSEKSPSASPNGYRAPSIPAAQTNFFQGAGSPPRSPTANGLSSGNVVRPASPGPVRSATQQASTAFQEEEKKRQEQIIMEKAKQEEDAKKKLRDTARADLQKFYDERNAVISRRKEQNAMEEKLALQSTQQLSGEKGKGCGWERVVGLIDFSKEKHERDTGRMKQILLQLKNSPPVVN